MTENRILHADKVRELCIRQNWYNAGNNQNYDDILEYAEGHNGTLEDIRYIAEDIYNHTVSDDWDSYNKKDILENIAFHLVNDCCTTFICWPSERR